MWHDCEHGIAHKVSPTGEVGMGGGGEQDLLVVSEEVYVFP